MVFWCAVNVRHFLQEIGNFLFFHALTVTLKLITLGSTPLSSLSLQELQGLSLRFSVNQTF